MDDNGPESEETEVVGAAEVGTVGIAGSGAVDDGGTEIEKIGVAGGAEIEDAADDSGRAETEVVGAARAGTVGKTAAREEGGAAAREGRSDGAR